MFQAMLYPRKGESLRLKWRIWAFFLGAVLGLTGIYLEVSWLLTVALVVLFGAAAHRVWPAHDADSEEEGPTTL